MRILKNRKINKNSDIWRHLEGVLERELEEHIFEIHVIYYLLKADDSEHDARDSDEHVLAKVERTRNAGVVLTKCRSGIAWFQCFEISSRKIIKTHNFAFNSLVQSTFA